MPTIIIAKQSLNGVEFLKTDVSPLEGGGLAAPVGSIAYPENGSGSFYKFGAADTNWIRQSNKIVAGVLRNIGDGWFVITSGGHTPINIDSVTNNTSVITVDYTSLGVSSVVSFIAVPDEDFNGTYQFGSSVGLTATTINISKPIVDRLSALITHTGGGTFTSNNGSVVPTYNASNGILTLTHSSYSSDVNIPLFNNLPDAVGKETIFQNSSGSAAATSTSIKMFNLDGTQKTLADPEIYRFYFERQKTAMKVNIQNPNNVSSATGNIWIFGLFN